MYAGDTTLLFTASGPATLQLTKNDVSKIPH